MEPNVWINEVDYRLFDGDNDVFFEVAGDTNVGSLAGWRILTYGENGSLASIVNIGGLNLTGGVNGISTASRLDTQNVSAQPSPIAVALVDGSDNVVQFLSFGALITAQDGLAKGMTATATGVQDTDLAAASVQLTGAGHQYSDFTWTVSGASEGTINVGQSFTASNQPASFSGNTFGSVEEYWRPSASGQIIVTDPDSSNAVVAQTHARSDSGYGTFDIDTNGNWTFDLKPGLKAIEALKTDEFLSDTLSIATADGTTTKIAIIIRGINDATGDKHANVLMGTDTRDFLDGAAGNDSLKGLKGDDILVGGTGRDKLYGGGGADLFVFGSKDSLTTAKALDTVEDFKHQELDHIDLSGFADNLHVVGGKSAAITTPRSVWVDHEDGHDLVYINADKKDGFDAAIDVVTKTHLVVSDFIL